MIIHLTELSLTCLNKRASARSPTSSPQLLHTRNLPTHSITLHHTTNPQQLLQITSASRSFESTFFKGGYKRTIPSTALARHCLLDLAHLLVVVLVNPKGAPDLGIISGLPTEMQQMILKSLDVESLLVFRRVNRCGMRLVDGLIGWEKVVLI
jgi:hypothetical protein